MKKKLAILMALIMALTVFCAAAEELPDGSGLSMAGIIHTEDTFGQMMAAGMQDACNDTGVYMYRGCTSLDMSKEFELVQTYKDMVDLMVTSPTGSEGSNATYRQVADAGITVCYVNSAEEANENTAFLSGQFSSNNFNLAEVGGRYAAEWWQKNHPGEKLVIATTGVREGSTAIAQRYEGFLSALTESGIEYEEVARGYGYVQDTIMQIVGDMLTANPDINMVLTDCNGAGIGAVMAIKAAGMQDQVKVVTIDIDEQICDLLCEENPVMIGAAGQDGYTMAYNGTIHAIRVCLGEIEGSADCTFVDAKLLTAEDPAAAAEYKTWLHKLATGEQ